MSTTLLQFKFRVGGALIAATSVVLSDATGTYGVRRTDTLATVVADATAMTAVSTGVYEYSFTDPAVGLNYQWVAEVVYAGSTSRFQFTATGGGDASAIGGYYVTKEDAEDEAGTYNLAAYSNRQGGTDADNDHITRRCEHWDAYVDNAYASIGITARWGTTTDTYLRLKALGAKWVVAELYRSRGVRDTDAKGTSGVMSAMKDEAEHGLAALVQQYAQERAFPDGDDYRVTQGRYIGSTPVVGLVPYWW